MAKKSELETQDEELIGTAKPKPRQYGPQETETAALRCYLAFGATLGYKTPKGEALEPWEQLTKPEQDAWRNAAFAVLTGG